MDAPALIPTTTSAGTRIWQLRNALLVLSALTAVGTAVELATVEHWESAVQLIPWVALVVLAVAIGLAARRPGHRRLRLAQLLGGLVLVTGLFGLFEHAESNVESGALDRTYGDTWDTRSEASKWWLAVTGEVGPNPVLAPAILTEAAVLLLLATAASDVEEEH